MCVVYNNHKSLKSLFVMCRDQGTGAATYFPLSTVTKGLSRYYYRVGSAFNRCFILLNGGSPASLQGIRLKSPPARHRNAFMLSFGASLEHSPSLICAEPRRDDEFSMQSSQGWYHLVILTLSVHNKALLSTASLFICRVILVVHTSFITVTIRNRNRSHRWVLCMIRSNIARVLYVQHHIKC